MNLIILQWKWVTYPFATAGNARAILGTYRIIVGSKPFQFFGMYYPIGGGPSEQLSDGHSWYVAAARLEAKVEDSHKLYPLPPGVNLEIGRTDSPPPRVRPDLEGSNFDAFIPSVETILPGFSVNAEQLKEAAQRVINQIKMWEDVENFRKEDDTPLESKPPSGSEVEAP